MGYYIDLKSITIDGYKKKLNRSILITKQNGFK